MEKLVEVPEVNHDLERLSKLERIIHKEKLERHVKDKYLEMAQLFVMEFSVNIMRSSIELSEVYREYSMDDWKEFLSYPQIQKYNTSFKNEMISQTADVQLLAGDKTGNAVKVREMLSKGQTQNNSNIVVMLLPLGDGDLEES